MTWAFAGPVFLLSKKMRINWAEKEKELSKILSKAKKNANNNYDCVIPISGGKDSTFQLHILKKIYGLKPLAVTFNHNWLSRVGYYNLMNCLEEFSVDHIMFTPNRSLVNRMAKRSISLIGDSLLALPFWNRIFCFTYCAKI